MGSEGVLLEELASYPEIARNIVGANVIILNQEHRRIKGHSFKSEYLIKIIRGKDATLAEKIHYNNTDADVINDIEKEEETSSDEDIKSWASDYAKLTNERKPSFEDSIIRFKDSHNFLPHEREIVNNMLYSDMKLFTIGEILTIDNNAAFPSCIVKQLLGKDYDNLRKGQKIQDFKIMYNMNCKSDNKFCGGIIIPNENCNIISTMAKYFSCNYGGIMGFLDYYTEKECLNLECMGQDQFRIVYDKDEPLLRNQVVMVKCQANNDFYIGLEPVSQVKRRMITIDKEIIPQKSPYARKVKIEEEIAD